MRPMPQVCHLAAAFFFALAVAMPAAAVPEVLEEIVAVVNDDVVLASELEAEIDQLSRQAQAHGATLPPREQLAPQVLERLILVRLQLSMADRMGIRVDEATLNNATRRIAEQNNMDLNQFRVALQAEGIDFATFREALREEIAITQVRQRQVERRVQVTSQEIDQLLEESGAGPQHEYLVGHILIATPEGANAEDVQAARQRAEQIRARLERGADFASVAAAESDAPTALDGGSLGWRAAGALPTLFAGTVPTMDTGAISEVIGSSSGFHIVQLQDRRRAGAQMITQTRARHILVAADPLVDDADEARQRIEALRDRLMAGADFETLAREHSDDRGTAGRGGDLGWFNPGTMVPEFERAARELRPGEISEPVQTMFGWHLIEVLERREQDVAEETIRIRAAEHLRARKVEEATEAWLRRLRDEAYIEIRLES